ncbi:hypothetical protein C0J52_06336 [Blattella germanica]|nr:hypothetical protein C0J52_06336 [Blattella germanica]
MSSILISASFMFIGYLIAHPSRDFLYSKDWWGMACVFLNLNRIGDIFPTSGKNSYFLLK